MTEELSFYVAYIPDSDHPFVLSLFYNSNDAIQSLDELPKEQVELLKQLGGTWIAQKATGHHHMAFKREDFISAMKTLLEHGWVSIEQHIQQ